MYKNKIAGDHEHFFNLSKNIIYYLNNFILNHPETQQFSSDKDKCLHEKYYLRWISCVVLPNTFKR